MENSLQIDEKSTTRKDEKSDVTSKSDSKVDAKIDDQEKVDVNDNGALKKDDESQATLPAVRTALDENMVLGVALEGSKRTLPIEEEEISPLSPSTGESKELAASRNGVGSSSDKEDKKEDQVSSIGRMQVITVRKQVGKCYCQLTHIVRITQQRNA